MTAAMQDFRLHIFCRAVLFIPLLSISNPFLLAMCVVLLSARKPILVGKLSRADGSAMPTHTWPAASHSAESRDAVIVHWGPFVSRDLPLYVTSLRLSIPQDQMSIVSSCHTGFLIPGDLKGAVASINEPHQILDFSDDLPAMLQLEDLPDRNLQLKRPGRKGNADLC